MLPYIAIGDLATFLGVATTALNAALADLAVAAAQAKVRRFLNQEITYHAADVLYMDGNGTRRIRLPERPVRNVALVEEGISDSTWMSLVDPIWQNLVEPPTWVTLDSSFYHVRGAVLVRWDGLMWRSGYANLRVTYDHGYDVGAIDSDTSDSDYNAPHVPADISMVTLALARRMYADMGATAAMAGSVKQETIGSYSYTLTDAAEKAAGVDLVYAEKSVLEAYRIKGAG